MVTTFIDLMGNEKCYGSMAYAAIINAKDKRVTFIGNEEDYKKLGLAKFVYE